MYEKLLAESEKYIETLPVKEVPILEMWDAMMERSESENFEMPDTIGDFECLLEADKRFIFVQKITEDEIDDVDLGEEEGEYEVGEDFFEVEEMEKLGFNQHQIVGLKKYEKKKIVDDDDYDLPVKRKTVPAEAARRKNEPKKTPQRPVQSTPKKKKK
ncbi:MAG: hypothetical protein ACYC09_12170 [Bacteroidota bacterium]